MRVRYSIILALTAVLALAAASAAFATTFGFVANLSGLNEVPANGSPATGTAILVYDDVANTLTTSVNFSGLTAPLTADHIHGPATIAQNAAVIHPFVGSPIGATAGSWTDVWSGLTAQQVGWLNTQMLYVNLHSQAFPGGEIRGQILPDATPNGVVSWGKLKMLYR